MSKRSAGPPPRSWLADARRRDSAPDGWRNSPFGEADEPGWAPAPTDRKDRAAYDAAHTQHRLSQSVRSLIRRQARSTEEVAADIGMSTDGLRRILAGTAHVTLTDLHRIAAALDREVRLTLRRPASAEAQAPDT